MEWGSGRIASGAGRGEKYGSVLVGNVMRRQEGMMMEHGGSGIAALRGGMMEQ